MRSRSVPFGRSVLSGSSLALILAFTSATAHAQIGIQRQKLVASDGGSGDEFGVNIAIDGDTVAVSADQDNSAAGSVYVYVRQNDGTWTQLQKLTASNAGSGDEFGFSVAVSGDWIAASARLEDTGTNDAGSVYIFQKQGSSYVQTQQLQASDRGNGDHFGASVAMDGNRLIVGAVRDDPKGSNSGSAYIFDESGGTWTESAKLIPSDGAADDQFGFDCDLSGDRAVVSTIWDNNLTGATYVFERQGGGTWSETQKLTASDKANGDEFGSCCGISGDSILVGARLENQAAPNGGSVYAFRYNGASWVQEDKFQGSDTANGDQFGFSLGLEGTRAVIGAYRADPSGLDNGGKLYIVERHSNGDWVQLAQMHASDPSKETFLGFCCAISGTRIVGGAVWDDQKGTNAGAAYVADSEFLRSDVGISVSGGGTLEYYINLGVAKAGSSYWVLGSFSGIFPGVVLHGTPVQLNWDLYLLYTITQANRAPFANSRGVLDADGGATMSITTPPGLDPALIGLELHHAVLTFTNSPGVRFTSASNPTPLLMEN